MALDFFSSGPIAEARRALDDEPLGHRKLRVWARELWDAAEVMAVAPADLARAQAALHREVVGRIFREREVASFSQARPAIEAALATEPGAETLALLRNAHQVLLAELEIPLAALARAQIRRWVAVGVVLLSCAVSTVAAVSLLNWIREPVDLARGRPFRVSSKFAECHPDQGECGGVPLKVFFHTLEEKGPWYMVDLERPTTFSWLMVRNRSDAAMMNAVPLVAEVSDDGVAFREIARRAENFVVWEPHFAPQTSRFLRLRVDRVSALHLEAVKVHR